MGHRLPGELKSVQKQSQQRNKRQRDGCRACGHVCFHEAGTVRCCIWIPEVFMSSDPADAVEMPISRANLLSLAISIGVTVSFPFSAQRMTQSVCRPEEDSWR